MPLFIGPQIFLCGLLVPSEQMPRVLELIGDWLPMSWAVDVVREVSTQASLDSSGWWRLGWLALFALGSLVLASWSMPRRVR